MRMHGYISQFASRREDWPDTYVIVEAEPGHWMATLALMDLVRLAHGERQVDLRGIRFRWLSDGLRLELGPVHVVGHPNAFLALARRIVDLAGSAAQLYEVPSARPWAGPVVTLPVEDVVVPDLRPVSPSAREDALLARAAGFPDALFQEIFGRGWREQGMSLDHPDAEPVYLWGQPVQLAAQISPEGFLTVGEPVGEWELPNALHIRVDNPTRVDASIPGPMLEAFVRDLLRRRRRKLTWCRSCGELAPPEMRYERDLCQRCVPDIMIH